MKVLGIIAAIIFGLVFLPFLFIPIAFIGMCMLIAAGIKKALGKPLDWAPLSKHNGNK